MSVKAAIVRAQSRSWPLWALTLAATTLAVVAHGLFGDHGFTFTLGWAFIANTPPRHLPVPLVTAALVAAIAASLAWLGLEKGGPRLAVRALLALATVDVLWALTSLVMTPPPEIRGVYAGYVRLVPLLAFGVLGLVAGVLSRQPPRAPLLATVLWASLLVAIVRLAIGPQPIAAGAIIVGGAIGIGIGRPLQAAAALVMRRASSWRRADITILFLLIGLAVVLRVGLAIFIWQAHGMDYPRASDDGDNYDGRALRQALGDESVKDYFYNMYVWLLSLLYRAVGHAPLAAGLLQSILGSAVVAATYLFARRAAGRGVALLAAALAAVSTVLVYLSAYLGAEALSVPAAIVALACLAYAVDRSVRASLLLCVVAGVLFGVAGATRDVLAGAPLAAVLWLAWAGRRAGWSVGRVASTCALFLAMAVAVIGSFDTYSNRLEVLSKSSVPSEAGWEAAHPRLSAIGINQGSGLAGAVSVVASDPVLFARALAEEISLKGDMLYFSSWFSLFDLVFLIQRTDLATTLELYFLVVLAVGALRWLRKGGGVEARWLGAAFVLYGFVAHVLLTFTNGALRYRAVYDMIFLSVFAFGVFWLWEIIRSPRRETSSSASGGVLVSSLRDLGARPIRDNGSPAAGAHFRRGVDAV